MNKILIEEMPIAPLYYDVTIRLIQPYARLKANDEHINLKEVKIEENGKGNIKKNYCEMVKTSSTFSLSILIYIFKLFLCLKFVDSLSIILC